MEKDTLDRHDLPAAVIVHESLPTNLHSHTPNHRQIRSAPKCMHIQRSSRSDSVGRVPFPKMSARRTLTIRPVDSKLVGSSYSVHVKREKR